MNDLFPATRRLLAARGFDTPEKVEEFLDTSVSRLVDPEALPGITEAADIVARFVAAGRRIVVCCDYDCDGVCAGAILSTALRSMGATVDVFVPDRFAEGFGMSAASLARMEREHPDMALVVTVDNGITSAVEVKALRDRGVAVVVTDHHKPGPDLPEADALVNPRVASTPGCEDLCGAGVAFFLASALARRLPPRGARFGMKALVMAGLATVADIMPLTGQNRVIVAASLAAFHRHAPEGLRMLYLRASRAVSRLRAWDYGFVLGPRINAAGRIGSARLAYDLLVEEDKDRTNQLAQELDALNATRKTIEKTMVEEVTAKAKGAPGPAVVVQGDEKDGWHSGVAGIVAARVLANAGVPVAVVVGARGSVRAPVGYDVHRALLSSSDALERAGGHAAAGGFTVKPGRFDDFRELFSAACAVQARENADAIARAREVRPEIWVEPEDITMDLARQLAILEPFGVGNPEPRLGLARVRFRTANVVSGGHASFMFANPAIPRAMWWGHGEDVEEIRRHSAAEWDVVFTLAISSYMGDEHPELRLLAVHPSRATEINV